MKKYYSLLFSVMILIINIISALALFKTSLTDGKPEYLILFLFWFTTFILQFYTIEYKNEVINIYEPRYYKILPVKRKDILYKEFFHRLLDKKYLLLVVSSLFTLIFFGLKLRLKLFYLLISIIFTIGYNSFFFLVLKNSFRKEKGMSGLQILSQIYYFFAFFPYFLILGNINVSLDIISRYIPFGGLFLAVFVYKRDIIVNIILIILSLLLLIVLYKKASKKWDI